jgi:hypothetical protein
MRIESMETIVIWFKKLPLILLFAISAISVGMGDYLAKKWSLEPGWGKICRRPCLLLRFIVFLSADSDPKRVGCFVHNLEHIQHNRIFVCRTFHI